MRLHRVTDWHGYTRHRTQQVLEYASYRETEQALLPLAKQPFVVPGYSYTAGQMVDFQTDYRFSEFSPEPEAPLWREHLICPVTGLNNRMRASMHLLDHVAPPGPTSRIYISERLTPLYDWLDRRYPGRVVGSEYFGPDCSLTFQREGMVQHQDLASLTFPSGAFDRVLSFECLEHMPDHMAALRECYRVLDNSGILLLSVPFITSAEEHLVRARIGRNGAVEHLMPPEYHPDPIRASGSLCYRHFGWQILDELREVGFREACALLYWSREFGYLGGEQAQFIACKDGSDSSVQAEAE